MLQWGAIVKKLPGVSDEHADKIAASSPAASALGFLQDVEIWKNKTRIDNPLLCEEDGPVYQLRRWYDQFYVDAADVTDDMTGRFEFEVDTTRANEAWQREVTREPGAAGRSRGGGLSRDAGRSRAPAVPHRRAAPRARATAAGCRCW